MTKIKVLGIDPALASMGWALVKSEGGDLSLVNSGIITTDKDKGFADRLIEVHDDVQELCETYRPDTAYIEQPFLKNTGGNNLLVVSAYGAILLALRRTAGIDPNPLMPSSIKKGVTGNGRADKRTVREVVRNIYKIGGRRTGRDDEFDAIATATLGCRIELEKLEEAHGTNS